MKWDVGSRSGHRTIIARLPKKRLRVQCDCGSEPSEISLPSFLQSPKCRECCKDETIEPVPATAGPIEHSKHRLPPLVDLAPEAVCDLMESQGNACCVCRATEADAPSCVIDSDGCLHMVCCKCSDLVDRPLELLDSAAEFVRSTPW